MNNLATYLLYPVSFIYASVVLVRNLFFDVGIFRTKKLPVPVISVGNLTTGGTGKTPLTGYIARMLQAGGYKTGIISRGYRRSSRGYVPVSDGNRVLVDAQQGGDEPVMLAHLLPGVAVAVDEKRYRGGTFLLKDFGVDIIIMDDGFQHRMLHRDFDIVLIDASQPGHLRAHIPSGRLRERKQSLRRADIVVVTKYEDDSEFKAIERLIHRYAPVPVIGANLEPDVCVDVVRNEEVPIESVVTKTAYLFAGIAQPEGFRRIINRAGITTSGMSVYPDHYRYSEHDVNVLLDESKQSGADILLTTEKDAVRLHPYKHMFDENIPLYALRASVTLTHDDNGVLENFLYRMKNKHKRSETMN